ncbi:FAD binding domain-containing protein [Truncatella angustata]|uniref:FAD binding domain-containing protein n=1 Tax=Truncatella angustata TaxID=152316 RepID=A0A9P8ZYI1_9PEZI|nr:FAD binding domain-containing protein [Truncatella angustata]KAH6654051.1 FAD binding domain-containing protein [Truncatella angustata]
MNDTPSTNSIEIAAVNGDLPQSGNGTTEQCDVCIVGAGPSGLMLATTLTRFGLNPIILDERLDQTAVGRADGIQPKTIETFRMLGICDELLRLGIKIYDICMWRGSSSQQLERMGREVHYPDSIVDLLEPYILIGHQGMIEKAFLDDLHKRGVEVRRSHHFTKCHVRDQSTYPVQVHSKFNITQEEKIIEAEFVVGCDGAHSSVRKMIFESPRNSGSSVWGVLDGELNTDFPDIWSKTVIFSEEHGSILIIPRERNMTRFYIEMKESASAKDLGQDYVMQRAKDIFSPYHVEWKSVEWFGKYQVAQKVAEKFSDPTMRIFIGGDASHSHSPKAAQGMNTSVHDTWNLGWKLNLAVRGFAKPVLLQTYEQERQKIGQDLIDFDYEHANQIAGGDAAAIAENFQKNIRFISGVGAEYATNVINKQAVYIRGEARPGCNLPPAKATRYYDANPVDLQLDIPVLGQFRIYTILGDVKSTQAKSFLNSLSDSILDPTSLVSRLSAAATQSYSKTPRKSSPEEVYTRPERYTALSEFFTYSLITTTHKSLFEISDLPPILAKSPWTVYLDDVPSLDSKGKSCTEKWIGNLEPGEAVVIVVRPDGYVAAVDRYGALDERSGMQAARTLDSYFGGFLQVPT